MIRSIQIDALPTPSEIERMIKQGSENPELTAYLDEWRVNKATARKRSLIDQIWHWGAIVGAVASIVGIACVGTYLITWRTVEAEADARIDRVINAQPSELRALLLLRSYGGSLSKEPISMPEGPRTGVVMRNGTLPTPWISADKRAAVVQLP